MSVLTVSELTTRLLIEGKPIPVVENLSFDLYPGKTLAIVGESGCGKSMTAHSLMRILPSPPALPPEGEVLYRNENLLAVSERRMRTIRGGVMGMIFQDPGSALNPVYTIGMQLLEVAAYHLNLYDEEAYILAIEALNDVGISAAEERFSDYPHQLSGGMKQRVMIAMALMCQPEVLIADEPTTALDVTIQAQVLDLIRRLQEKRGMAVLLITHDMGIVAEMADEVIVMYASLPVEKGSARAVFDIMAHPYTQGLFGSIPDPEKGRAPLHPIKGSVPTISQYPKGCRFHPRCPFVMEKCKSGVVPSFSLGEGHEAACWLHDGSLESQQRRQACSSK